jgi:hypothetical protein
MLHQVSYYRSQQKEKCDTPKMKSLLRFVFVVVVYGWWWYIICLLAQHKQQKKKKRRKSVKSIIDCWCIFVKINCFLTFSKYRHKSIKLQLNLIIFNFEHTLQCQIKGAFEKTKEKKFTWVIDVIIFAIKIRMFTNWSQVYFKAISKWWPTILVTQPTLLTLYVSNLFENHQIHENV